ncbi:synaptobrevin-like [Xiphias gladius]|uniref:synaptobrevin-like n=1 Tax=Xiphias gladius TaxID=8245 RepID=UPI001A999598|nr:synaptobrevin-like [Xiphias gladius]
MWYRDRRRREGGRIPGRARKQSSQHSVGIRCTAVSSCRPIRHRGLQYCKALQPGHTVNYQQTRLRVSVLRYFADDLQYKCIARRSAPDAAAPGAPGAPGADGAPAGPPAGPPNTTSNRRLQQTQAQVEEVVDIMRVNVDKVLERDQKLSELDDRADALQAGASQFESCAAKLKNKYWWKNCKMMIMMGIIGVIVVGIIFLYFFY